MLDHWWEFCQKVWQLSLDLWPDGASSVLEFGRRLPAGNDVVGVDLGKSMSAF